MAAFMPATHCTVTSLAMLSSCSDPSFWSGDGSYRGGSLRTPVYSTSVEQATHGPREKATGGFGRYAKDESSFAWRVPVRADRQPQRELRRARLVRALSRERLVHARTPVCCQK